MLKFKYDNEADIPADHHERCPSRFWRFRQSFSGERRQSATATILNGGNPGITLPFGNQFTVTIVPKSAPTKSH